MAAVEVSIIGNGFFAGAKSNITTYSVQEDSTPTVASDTTGGTGQLSFSVTEDSEAEGTMLLLGDTAELSDGARGTTVGKINTVEGNGFEASVTADSRLNQLVATRQAQPIRGTLREVLEYYLSLANITDNVIYDDDLPTNTITLQGWEAVIYDQIKQLCLVTHTEISLVSDQIVIRPLRTHTLLTENDTKRSWSVTNGELAQNIEINYNNNVYRTATLVYPAGGWTEDVTVYTVDANQTVEEDIELPVSLYSIQQPSCISFVAQNYTGPSSVYTVAGNDGLPITPAQWKAQGGDLTVSILPDTKTIRIKITGPTMTEYAPYSIGVASGPSDYYSTLRIVGTGVFTEQKTLRVPTGAEPGTTPTEVGITVDNFAIRTLQQALDAAVGVVGVYSGPSQVISVSSTEVNRRNDDGSLAGPTFGEVDAYYGPMTFGEANSYIGPITFGGLTAFWENRVRSRFNNQAFGNVAGARVERSFGMYRVRSANITESSIDYTADSDTIFSDANEKFAGATFGDMNAKYAGKTFGDVRLIPLWD